MRLWPLYRRYLQHGDAPILLGPFRGEVGFEALYWLPWLRKQLAGIQAPIYPVTRGGAGAWYPNRSQDIDLYALRTPQDVRVENAYQNARTGALKQRQWTAFDKAVIKDAAKGLGLTRYRVLHPRWMFQELEPFWDGKMAPQAFFDQCDFTPIEPPPAPEGLPPQFVAVRFYFRATFPYHPPAIAFAKATVERLASQIPVVLLHSGIHSDEHVDFQIKGPNIIPLRDLVSGITEANNLAVLSSVLGKATAFVGTYGGLAQLALRLKVPSVSFYADWNYTAIAHKQLAETLSIKSGIPFVVQRLTEAPFIKSVLPDIAFQVSSSNAKRTPAQPYAPLAAGTP